MDEISAAEHEASPTDRRKPRICQYCKRHFRRYEHLERHLRIREHTFVLDILPIITLIMFRYQ